MAELSFQYAKYIGTKFIEYFNAEYATNYTWDDKFSYPAEEPYDIFFIDGTNKLGVQHKKVLADAEREIVRPKKADKVIDILKSCLRNYSEPALMVHLNFENLPNDQAETQDCAYWLEEIITHKVQHAIKPTYFSYDSDYDEHILPKIKKWISKLEIMPHPNGSAKGIVFSYGTSGSIVQPWLDNHQTVMRLMENIKSKYTHPEEMVILLENYSFTIDEYYKKQIIESLKGYPFKEIWVVETFVCDNPVFRVYP